MAATRMFMPPPMPGAGPAGGPEGNMPPDQIAGTMNANPPPETTPPPQSETGRPPKAPKVPSNVVKGAMQGAR